MVQTPGGRVVQFRIDLQVEWPALPASELAQAPPGESAASIRTRCTLARGRAITRQGKTNHAMQYRRGIGG